jgi:sortase A
MQKKSIRKKKMSPQKAIIIKIAVAVLELTALGLIIYLVALPIYPVLQYNFSDRSRAAQTTAQSIEIAKTTIQEFKAGLPAADFAVSPNRLIINKIGVNAPIVEAKDEKAGLARGAWRLPESSTPDKGGNTVITGHRFKYLPPNNLTFFLFDKLAAGDIISVIWQNKEYYYRVKEIKIIPPTDLSILDPSDKPVLTLFTCHPVYSTEKRLVIVAETVEE